MSGTTSILRGRTWLRVLVLLVALWVPGAHVQADVAPALTAAGETAEHDGLDTALRPPSRTLHRADVPERPAPLPDPASGTPAPHPSLAAPRAPYAPPVPRTVVLRC
ncbi:hypothetical protein ACGFT2_25565 [Streptomyces sp. NPDC048514]|uniref:hypothetical protein n=1 Tax=Streptomyces sp. NPDC048514 TaxID=3365564 RepID=UPI003712EC8A